MLSSWYWYRKEHQTRYEFAIRKLCLPCEPPIEVAKNCHVGAPAQPRHPNAGDVLFRYGDLRWTHLALTEGSLRISAARSYFELERTDDARWDDELNKHSFLSRRCSRITTRDGQEIRPTGDIKRTVSSPNYFVICMSCEWDSGLFSAFNANSCLVIRKPDQLASLLDGAANEELNGWLFHYGSVCYFDPYEWKSNEPFDAALCKDFRFAYQREYRFMWLPPPGQRAAGHKELKLSPLLDSAELYDAQGTRLL
jgi:hypothetical protein